MILRAHRYKLARSLMDRNGGEAESYASAMIRRCLEEDDLAGAGTWLVIGSAIDELERLPPGGRRH
jgi:hypothetical protein